MIPVRGYAAFDAAGPLGPIAFERREPGPDEVLIDIRYCGVCHSDLHFARNDTGRTRYPLVPGHEIVGLVERVGADVTRFRPGDRVGVGCLVDSCRRCGECDRDEEQYCAGAVGTYGGVGRDGEPTRGGYSTKITVDQHFVLGIPDALPLDAAAPLLCAGITTYSPLRTWRAGPGTKVAVIGVGGLGHMAIKLAAAMGCEVTAVSTSDRKRADAERFGARDFLVSSDPEAVKAAAGRFDLILDTVSGGHAVQGHVGMLARDGTIVLLGLSTEPLNITVGPLLSRRRRVAGSMIGGIRETQEMLDFCAAHGIASDIEVIPMAAINDAYDRLGRSDVRYRFVIDMASMT